MSHPKTRVVMNRENFGAHVMAGSAISAKMQQVGEDVARAAGGGSVRLITERVRAGGSRVRAHVANGTTDAEEAKTNALTRALFSVVGPSK